MLRWLESASYPIGIDLGAQSIRMLQFRSTALAAPVLRAAATIDRGTFTEPRDASEAAKAVAATLRRAGFRGRDCVLALSPSLLHSRSIRLPQMPDADIAQALQWEVKDRFGFEPEADSIAFFRAGEVRRGTEVRDELLVFAATPLLLREHLTAFMQAGLRVLAIDVQPCAMLRALARAATAAGGDPTGGSRGVLDIGASGSQFFIQQAGRLVFYKFIEIGAQTLDSAVAQKLGVPPAEAAALRQRAAAPNGAEAVPEALGQALQDALRVPYDELARELDLCLRYQVITFRATRPELLTLVGSQAQHKHLTDILSSTLGLTVEAAQPLTGAQNLTAATRPDRASEWAVAAGLALYPVKPQVEAAA